MLHFNILDDGRKDILPLLAKTKELGFYLAGGTALALQLGHRDSIDFDFFIEKDFSTETLFTKLENIFEGHKLLKTQEEANTLTLIIDESIKLSFFKFKYPLLEELIDSEYFYLCSQKDIACMKSSAITQRAAEKDYIDIYYLLEKIELKELKQYLSNKMPSLDFNLVLKSLVYFEDLEPEEIIFKEGFEVSLDQIKSRLESLVRTYLNQI